jgi:hypothetical protein
MVKKNREVWRKMGLFRPDSDPANQLQKKKPRSSFAARPFPVYNLMKSLQTCLSKLLVHRLSPAVLRFDNTKVRRPGARVKDKKVCLFSLKKVFVFHKNLFFNLLLLLNRVFCLIFFFKIFIKKLFFHTNEAPPPASSGRKCL